MPRRPSGFCRIFPFQRKLKYCSAGAFESGQIPWVSEFEPRDVTLQLGEPAGRSSALNVIPGTVTEIREDASDAWSAEVVLDVGCPLLVQVTRKSVATLGLRPGVRVWAHVKAAALWDEHLE